MIIFADEAKPQAGAKQDQPSQALQITQPPISENHIRSLAASCAACHGTNGNSAIGNSVIDNSPGNTPSISNIYKPTFVSQMRAFRSGERPATVMHRHAKGLTLQEIDGLAEYFSKQPRQPVKAISPQHLSETYPN
ncbi:MAG TPA: c-type cytochrome [Methylotenera sp.]|nr:c-type cytochrome [Methylotenera sp.]